MPHRVRPGSTPSTRETGCGAYGLIAPARSSAPSRPDSSGEHLFATLPCSARPRGEARRRAEAVYQVIGERGWEAVTLRDQMRAAVSVLLPLDEPGRQEAATLNYLILLTGLA
jgi:hypothetical protein